MSIVTNADATVFAPGLTPVHEAGRTPWPLPWGRRLAVSLLVHAPSYRDVVPADAVTPSAMQGGVGRDTSEPRHGQVARLSQWDFGLTVGLWRLLDIAERAGVPAAVALDADGVTTRPGLAQQAAARAGEVVARGRAANILLHPGMTEEQERDYLTGSREAVAEAAGRPVGGWFSPERAQTPRTTALLTASGFSWFGDWPVDERPLRLGEDSASLTAVPFGLETEDMFALYARGLPFPDYHRLLDETIDRLVADAEVVGGRFLGLSWFGWVLGQACFADVAEHVLTRLAKHPDVALLLPGEAAGLAGAR